MRDLLIRLALGSPCIFIALWQFRGTADRQIALLCTFPCLAAFALIIFPSATTVAAGPWAALFFPQREAAPSPELRRARTLCYNGDFEGALVEYECLLARFPRDLDLWSSCFELLLLKLDDLDQARRMLETARRNSVDMEFNRRLDHLFGVQVRRMQEGVPHRVS